MTMPFVLSKNGSSGCKGDNHALGAEADNEIEDLELPLNYWLHGILCVSRF